MVDGVNSSVASHATVTGEMESLVRGTYFCWSLLRSSACSRLSLRMRGGPALLTPRPAQTPHVRNQIGLAALGILHNALTDSIESFARKTQGSLVGLASPGAAGLNMINYSF